MMNKIYKEEKMFFLFAHYENMKYERISLFLDYIFIGLKINLYFKRLGLKFN